MDFYVAFTSCDSQSNTSRPADPGTPSKHLTCSRRLDPNVCDMYIKGTYDEWSGRKT